MNCSESRGPRKSRFKSPEDEHQQSFFECADLILSWLSPRDLASASSTCKTLHQISKPITARRSSDASRGFEKLPIPFINTFDTQPYSYFLYTPSQTLASPLSQQWGSNPQNPTSLISETVENESGCDCSDCFDERDGGFECPCSRLKPEFLSAQVPGLEAVMKMECGPSCRCALDCENRMTQGGVSVRLRIVKDGRKGWGLYAAQFIQSGQFICEYAGELLTTTEARRRQSEYDELASGGRFASALLVVREHLPSGKACFRINIDATRVGNVARFINHSCDGGNLFTVLVRNSGALIPRLCFFASKDILESEELAFSYGEVRLRSNGLRCFCGSSDCFGVLPSEQT